MKYFPKCPNPTTWIIEIIVTKIVEVGVKSLADYIGKKFK